MPALAWWLGQLQHRPLHHKVSGSISGHGPYRRQSVDVFLQPPPPQIKNTSSGDDHNANLDSGNGDVFPVLEMLIC